MRFISLLLALLLSVGNAYAAPQRALLIDSSERALGTADNPINTSINEMFSITNKPSYDALSYKQSYKISGLTLSYSGAADNYTLAAGQAILNGRNFGQNVNTTATVAASPLISESGYSLKDPHIFYENGTYYMFYDKVDNAGGNSERDIWYATATSLNGTWTQQAKILDSVTNKPAIFGTSGLYSPSVIKVGSTYYLYVSGNDGSNPRVAYWTSSSLTSGYTGTGTIVLDNVGTAIPYADGEVSYYNGNYYLVTGDVTSQHIKLYTSANPSLNSWTFVSNILYTNNAWEASTLQAPFLVPGNPFLLFYGGRASTTTQRVGLAVSDEIGGLHNFYGYKRVGANGMIFLDSPSTSGTGALSHPTVFYDKGTKTWYLYLASCENTANDCKIVGYRSTDLVAWKSISYTTQLFASQTNYVYINLAGQLIHATDLPYNLGTSNTSLTTGIPEGIGYLRIGSLTVNSSRQVTASSDYTNRFVTGANVGIGTIVPPNALYVVGTPMFTTGLNIGIGTASPTRLCIANNAVETCP